MVSKNDLPPGDDGRLLPDAMTGDDQNNWGEEEGKKVE
jgi:hypothetical protein